MKQALHIFRANARHLWPRIALVMLLAGSHAAGVRGAGLLLVPACWLLIAMLVHEETIPGDRQFWVTRPYRWTSLLGAKLLFVLAFVSVPLILSDFWILQRSGFPAIAHLGGVLERQTLITLWLIVPPLAIASVTSGIAQFSGAAFPLALVYIADGAGYLQPLSNFGVAGFNWLGRQILELAMAVVLSLVIVRQYAARRTLSGRVLTILVFLVPALPASRDAALRLAMRLHGPAVFSPAVIEADYTRRPEWEGLSCFVLPVRFKPERNIEPLGVAITLHAAGFQWNSGWRNTISLVEHGSGHWEKVCLEKGEYDRAARQGELTVGAKLVSAAWKGATETRIPLPNSRVAVAGIGACGLSPFGLICHTPLRPEPRGVAIWEEQGLHLAASPYGHFHFPEEILDGLAPVLTWRPLVMPDFRRPDFVPGLHTELVFSSATNPIVFATELVFDHVHLTTTKGAMLK